MGNEQSSEAVATTIARTSEINSEVVRGMVKQGLEKSWVEKQAAQYAAKLEEGGAALKNTQLKPRLELMERILQYWPE